MERVVSIVSDDVRTAFRRYAILLKPIIGNIRDREIEVLSELMYECYVKKDIKNINDRFKIILSSESRKEMSGRMNITTSCFNVNLGELRKLKLLVNNILPSSLIVDDLDFDKKDLVIKYVLKLKPSE